MKYASFSNKVVKIIKNCGFSDVKRISILNFYKKFDSLLVWKVYRKKTEKFAKFRNIPITQIEDAFVGYIEDSSGKMQSVGLYLCKSGKPYYDASNQNSAILECVKFGTFEAAIEERVRSLIEKIVQNKITKYNRIFDEPFTPQSQVAPVLVIDQLLNDSSITLNNHGREQFEKMLVKARKLANGMKFYVKPHPRGGGYLKKLLKPNEAVIIHSNTNIFDVIPYIEKVLTVSSQVGFECLMAKKEVHTFGTPFYAGYSLTNDDIPIERVKTNIEKLFWATYVAPCRYFIANVECNLEEICDVVITHKKLATEDSKINRYFFYKIPLWKMHSLTSFIFAKNSKFIRISKWEHLKKYSASKEDAIIVWGFKGECENVLNYAQENKIPVITFEDGFIRSVGLGSNFTPPYSFAFDRDGIYYNPQKPSQLELIVKNLQINENQKQRIKNLIENITEMEISKYNVGKQNVLREIIQKAGKRKIILITGQVEDDMSIIKGATMVSSYSHLCEKVRTLNPNAFIIYKHHPDVICGNRKGYISSAILLEFVDCVLENENIINVIKIVEEVHTITSLAGFEALLHGKKVVNYGLPFYGGYGFTGDNSLVKHNRKPVDFKTFCYACLIEYPRYTQVGLKIALTPEIVIKKIHSNKNQTPQKQTYLTRKLKQAFNLIKLYIELII